MIDKLKPYFTPLGIDVQAVLEKYPDSMYVGQFPHAGKDRSGELVFFDRAVDVFYNPKPDIESGHTNYFTVYVRDGHAYISDASYVTDILLSGIVDDDGDIMYARYQHDFRYTKDQKYGVDGGGWIKSKDGWYMMGRMLGGVDGRFPKGVSLRVIGDSLSATPVKLRNA